MSLRAIFAGTPDFATPSLHALLLAPLDLLAVYTQPDRPAGRGRRLRPSPIRKIAADAGLTVRQPTLFSEEIPYLAALEPDLLIVVAYGLILPQAVLDIPRHGCINVHASLLPRWRGAAPIQRAIEAGDHEIGISLMRINKHLETTNENLEILLVNIEMRIIFVMITQIETGADSLLLNAGALNCERKHSSKSLKF